MLANVQGFPPEHRLLAHELLGLRVGVQALRIDLAVIEQPVEESALLFRPSE
jgi:hypothetical protein